MQLLQVRGDGIIERCLDVTALWGREGVTQPLFTPCQHAAEQVLELPLAVVEVHQQPFDVWPQRVVFEHAQRGARRLAIEPLGLFAGAGRGTEGGQQRHLPRQRVAQAVECLDPQPVRIAGDLPALACVLRQRGACQLPGTAAMGLRRLRIGGGVQRGQDAVAHLRRGLAREGDRVDLFRVPYPRQQA